MKDPKFDLPENEEARRDIFDTLAKANRQHIAEIVFSGVAEMLKRIERERGEVCPLASSVRSADFVMHSRILSPGALEKASQLPAIEVAEKIQAETLRGNDGASCPPGFMLIDGICVPS